MKAFLILILSHSFAITAIGQDYPDSGFTNKDDAKNLTLNGFKEGKWVEYFDANWKTPYGGDVLYFRLIVYKQGMAFGIRRDYYISGELQNEYHFSRGKMNGIAKWYYQSGKLEGVGRYINGERTGRGKWYYENGKLQGETRWSHDKLDGVRKDYNEKEKLKKLAAYSNGEKNGIEKVYDTNGRLNREYHYHNGKLNGTLKDYFEDGKLAEMDMFTDGKANGEVKIFYENGELKEIGSYRGDWKTGIWKDYDTSGRLISTKNYDEKVNGGFNLKDTVGLIDTFRFKPLVNRIGNSKPEGSKQRDTIKAANLIFEKPNLKWSLKQIKDTNGRKYYIYKREPIIDSEGREIIPNIAFMVETEPDTINMDVMTYSINRRGMFPAKTIGMFNWEQGNIDPKYKNPNVFPKMKIKDAIGFIGVYNDWIGEHTVYLVFMMYKHKGIVIIMDMTSELFEKYQKEFNDGLDSIIEM